MGFYRCVPISLPSRRLRGNFKLTVHVENCMRRIQRLHGLIAATLCTGVALAAPSEPSMAEMQWHRRVLMISTPAATDAQYRAQQRALSKWTGGNDRDVSVIRIEGDTVSGSREAAAELRDRYSLPAATFTVALIGKDGHVALRSTTSLTGAQIEGVIDAMPMRKSGQR
jgi:hypothetical protein